MKKRISIMAGLLAMALVGSAQAATMFAVQDSGANDKMVVTDGGFIGVGTNTPTSGVMIVGAPGNAAQLQNRTVGVDSANGGGGFMSYHNNATVNGGLPAAGDRLGYFLFGGYDGATARNGAGIVARTEEAWVSGGAGVGKQGSYFSFETTAIGTSGRAERLRISSVGNVGIGTSAIGTPVSKLQVVGLPGPYADNTAARTALGGANAVGAFYLCPGVTSPAAQTLCVVY